METRICKTCGWFDSDDEFLGDDKRCPYCNSDETGLKSEIKESIPRIGFEAEVKV